MNSNSSIQFDFVPKSINFKHVVKKHPSSSTGADLLVRRDGALADLYGHVIRFGDDGTISCLNCGMEKNVPQLLQESTGFREVVFKIHIISKFKEEECLPEQEDVEDLLDGVKDNKTVGPIPHKWEHNRSPHDEVNMWSVR